MRGQPSSLLPHHTAHRRRAQQTRAQAAPRAAQTTGAMGKEDLEMSDADFGNIERKVQIEDRPWTILCVLFFFCSAIGLGATAASTIPMKTTRSRA